ncbi:3-phosphoshikimate 1-carboxyvinyltransferase [archaeon HR06]|nr:3-phosphoshikimate 1-carboxyvinyltransferase [archaeon HR06]
MAAGALAGDVKVFNLSFNFPQADSKIVKIIEDLGGGIEKGENWVRSYHLGKFRGGTFNLKDSPDLLPVLAVMALNSEDKVEIKGVKHARYKESDRISSIVQEFKKLGVEVEEYEDGLTIYPPSHIKSVKLDPRGDHRLFMAFSLIGIMLEEGIEIEGVELIKVSYPNFLRDMVSLGVKLNDR